MKKIAKKIFIGSLIVGIVLILGIGFFFFFLFQSMDDGHGGGVRATFKTEKNESKEWKFYDDKFYTFSYPPGWIVENCIENCVDEYGVRVRDRIATDSAMIMVTNVGGKEYCNGEKENFNKKILKKTIEVKDGTKIYFNEGSDYGRVFHENTCEAVYAHDANKEATVEAILKTFTFKAN